MKKVCVGPPMEGGFYSRLEELFGARSILYNALCRSLEPKPGPKIFKHGKMDNLALPRSFFTVNF